MNKRSKGAYYEKLAEQYLRAAGIKILEINFRVRQGEIDLIGYDGRVLVFFEVKYRKNALFGLPEEAVDNRKRRQICKVALFYRMQRKISLQTTCRFDVIAICDEKIKWYKNAFEDELTGKYLL